MAIFNKNNNDTKSETTLISSGANIKGELKFDSMLHIDGRVEGVVVSSSSVVIGKNGFLSGKLKSARFVVNGRFEGEVEAEIVEILTGGILIGDIVSKELSIEAGAKFSGNSRLRDENEIKSIENLEIIEGEISN